MSVNSENFLTLSDEEAARLVRAAGPNICIYPIRTAQHRGASNLPLPAGSSELDPLRLLFSHGIDTLLIPLFEQSDLERNALYARQMVTALTRLTSEPEFLHFYQQYQVRVSFYGDFRRVLADTPLAFLTDRLDQLSDDTRGHNGGRLFFGLFTENSVEAAAELGVRYYQQSRSLPDHQALVTLYYGQYIEPANLIIAFRACAGFDVPLLMNGCGRLFLTGNSRPGLTRKQLRKILGEHLDLDHQPRAPIPISDSFDWFSGPAAVPCLQEQEDWFSLQVLCEQKEPV